MIRFKLLTAVVAMALLSTTSQAAFTLIGPGFGTVVVNPNTPGAPPGNTTVATGLVNANNFYSWNSIGADATPLASNSLNSLFTTQSTPIAAITLVSNNQANPTFFSPPALPVTGSSNLQRRTTGSSFSADFSGNEALLFANAGASGLIIDFAVPVTAAGLRLQNVAFGVNETFFMQAFNLFDNKGGVQYAAASPLYSGLIVNTSAFSPFSDTAEFYGVSANGGDTFTRLWLGFNSNTPFAIGTLEVTQAVIVPVDPNAVPVPPTIFAGIFGAVGLLGARRLRR